MEAPDDGTPAHTSHTHESGERAQQRHVLGIPEMDTQHAWLYSLFDKLEYTPRVHDAAFMGMLLDEIQAYVLFHFTCEEHLIRMYQAPGFAAHQSDHETAAHKLIAFLEDFEAARLNPARLRIFLTGWLMEHSRSSDEEYARHIRSLRGCQPG